MRSELRKGNLISLKDCYHHYPYPKAAFLVLSDTQDPFPPSAGAYIKVLDSRGTIINLPYSQLYMYEPITCDNMFKPGTLIALKSFLLVPDKEPCVYMVLDCELDPGDLQCYSLRYKVLNPDGIIEHISNPSMFWYEAIA